MEQGGVPPSSLSLGCGEYMDDLMGLEEPPLSNSEEEAWMPFLDTLAIPSPTFKWDVSVEGTVCEELGDLAECFESLHAPFPTSPMKRLRLSEDRQAPQPADIDNPLRQVRQELLTTLPTRTQLSPHPHVHGRAHMASYHHPHPLTHSLAHTHAHARLQAFAASSGASSTSPGPVRRPLSLLGRLQHMTASPPLSVDLFTAARYSQLSQVVACSPTPQSSPASSPVKGHSSSPHCGPLTQLHRHMQPQTQSQSQSQQQSPSQSQPAQAQPTIGIGADTVKIGKYTPEERAVRIQRYRDKKKRRNWQKKIKYSCRKKLADTRPRIKGRFVKTDGPPITMERIEALELAEGLSEGHSPCHSKAPLDDDNGFTSVSAPSSPHSAYGSPVPASFGTHRLAQSPSQIYGDYRGYTHCAVENRHLAMSAKRSAADHSVFQNIAFRRIVHVPVPVQSTMHNSAHPPVSFMH